MKLLLLNPPYPEPIQRRFNCSYYVNEFLYPPLELLSLAAVARRFAGVEPEVVDAIALRLSEDEVIARAGRADLLLALGAQEMIGDDLHFLNRLKAAHPHLPVGIFGYYATLYPHEILSRTSLDYLLIGEPENVFAEFLAWRLGQGPAPAVGLGWKENGEARVGEPAERIVDLDALPWPAYDLIDLAAYRDLDLPLPMAAVMAGRGCPQPCNYCPRSYSKRYLTHSVDSTIVHVKELIATKHIRSLRFMDDSVTVNRDYLLELCAGLEPLGLVWTANANLPAMTPEIATAMKRAGCRRLWFGLESGSDKILQAFGKTQTPALIREKLRVCRAAGVEAGGHIIVGHPEETEEDFARSVALIKGLDLDYLGVNAVAFYPGTELYEQYRELIDFEIFPYRCRIKDPTLVAKALARQKVLYRKFYFSPRVIVRRMGDLIRQPRVAFKRVLDLLKILFLPDPEARRPGF
ncbi:MAG TPA: radical SAM protein [bacterium]|nr:radical SAM protein [bacterium]